MKFAEIKKYQHPQVFNVKLIAYSISCHLDNTLNITSLATQLFYNTSKMHKLIKRLVSCKNEFFRNKWRQEQNITFMRLPIKILEKLNAFYTSAHFQAYAMPGANFKPPNPLDIHQKRLP